jgi:hypothetical protein
MSSLPGAVTWEAVIVGTDEFNAVSENKRILTRLRSTTRNSTVLD